MSSVTRPRGPLPRRVYWFRRTMVLGVAALLVVGVAQVLGGGSDGREGPKARVASAEPSRTPTGPSTPAADPTADTAGEPASHESRRRAEKRARKRTTTPLAQPSGPCSPSDLVVTPEVHDAHAGGDVSVALLFTTRLSEACTFAVSPDSVVVKLTSGDDRIWSSQQCPAAVPTTTVVARKAEPGRVLMTWNGQRSDDECSRTASWALPGYYHAEAAAFGSEPTDVQFVLGPAERETITRKPKTLKQQRRG